MKFAFAIKLIWVVQSPSQNISLNMSGKSGALSRASRAERGALRNVINAERDAVDADAPLTNGAESGR
jgi:hypothetical protein